MSSLEPSQEKKRLWPRFLGDGNKHPMFPEESGCFESEYLNVSDVLHPDSLVVWHNTGTIVLSLSVCVYDIAYQHIEAQYPE